MKITFYELLGLVKDGKAPKKIKFGNIELEYDEKCEDYYSYYGGGLFEHKFGNCKNFLNDEVSIIEESKKIEKIKSNGDEFYSDYIDAWIGKNKTDAYCEFLMNKINELIDEINNLKEKKDE